MKAPLVTSMVLLCFLLPSCFAADGSAFQVVPFEFDPYGTHLVAAQWRDGTGCPTNSRYAPGYFYETYSGNGFVTSYTDAACATADPGDHRNQGLLLVKTGPTDNDAYVGATLQGIPSTITELGYDVRKMDNLDPTGAQCSFFAPRFDVYVVGNPTPFVLGCQTGTVTQGGIASGSPTPTTWVRLRWGGSAGPLVDQNGVPLTGLPIQKIVIMFDEGQDFAFNTVAFGLTDIDNIDVNGVMVGRGPKLHDEDEGEGDDGNNDSFDFNSSQSHSESSSLSYHDNNSKMNLQSVNGIPSIGYNGTGCVTLAGPGMVNGQGGYNYTFAACNLAPLGIGNFQLTVTGPLGYVYNKSGTLTAGGISIHLP